MATLLPTDLEDWSRKIVFNFTDNDSTIGLANEKRTTVPFIIHGTFGSGTLTMQYSSDGVNWVADTELVYTSAGVGSFISHPYVYFRAALTGATTPAITITFFP